MYLRENSISITQDSQNVVFDYDHYNNAVTLLCSDLSIGFSTDDFRAQWSIFIATGRLSVTMNTVNIGVGLAFTTQTLPSGNIVPAINAVDVIVDIDKNDIKIDIHGNVWSDFADMFTVFFKNTVVDLIVDGIAGVLTETIPDSLNALFASSNGVTQLMPNGLSLDW